MAGVQFQESLTLGSPRARDLKPPPARSLLELARCDQALDSRKYQGPGRVRLSTPRPHESPLPQFSALPNFLPWTHAPILLHSAVILSSLASVSRPAGLKSPWLNSGPSSVPPASQSHFACQRRALKNCWHCQKPCVRYDSPNIPLFLLFC